MEIFIIAFLKITKKASLHHKMLIYDWNTIIICFTGRYVLHLSNDVEICFKISKFHIINQLFLSVLTTICEKNLFVPPMVHANQFQNKNATQSSYFQQSFSSL